MLGEITASLAHELNQPLTAILANAQAARLRAEYGDTGNGRMGEMLDDIAESARRAGDVIRRVRAWVNRDQVVSQHIDVNELVADVERLLHSELIIRNVRLTLNLDPHLPAVVADRIQLQQVILNLALNGMEAMHELSANERHLVIATSLLDSAVQVAVRDQGSGIDHHYMNRMFDPFFTTKPTGLGIGLSICSSIISAHGGRIWAANNPDCGATLFVTLPAAPAPT
jgi:two-component system sensor kinase FixL